MFTGIIQAIGEVRAARPEQGSVGLVIHAGGGGGFEDLALGESIAVDGACLTVARVAGGGSFHALASPETLARTTLGSLRSGSEVNLERALRPSDRLGGHFVLGHVDSTGQVLSSEPDGQALRVRFEVPAELGSLVVPKGSIAVDGVSLTVNEVEAASFAVTLVPFTASHTTLGRKVPGARVNLETDILAKHILKIVGSLFPGGPARSIEREIDLDFLSKHGFLK